jgi:GT2 family glycosyltransferase
LLAEIRSGSTLSANRFDMHSVPLVTVIVLNWNGCADLSECISSLKKCSYPALKILCVDNASTDNSVSMMESEFPEIETIVTSENLRWAGGNNFGIKYLGSDLTDFVLLLNNDTVVKPDAFESLVTAAVEYNSWAITPRICYADDETKVWYDGGLIGKYSGWIRHSGIRKKAIVCSDKIRKIDYGSGCALLLSKECIEKVGLIDESYFLYGEDCDYSMRITSAGGTIWHCPQSVVLHKVSQSTGSDSPIKAYLKSRSIVHLFKKQSMTWTVWPFQLLILFAQMVWFLGRGYPSTATAGYSGFFDELNNRPIKDLD